MSTYTLTVFTRKGEKLMDDSFQASSETEAKQIADEMVRKHGYETYPYRCTSTTGKLILFHS